ncbi:MAG: hypothetical protein MOB07_31365 [Acidobacteria bacterium]|nr:hypothetical protein [Acidobacteriota bacterium]
MSNNPDLTRPEVGTRWQCKVEKRAGAVVEGLDIEKDSVAFRFDGMQTVDVFELDHFLDWFEETPPGRP